MYAVIPFIPGMADSLELRFSLRALHENAENVEPMLVTRIEQVPHWYKGEACCAEFAKLPCHEDQVNKLGEACARINDDEFIYTTDDAFMLMPWNAQHRCCIKAPQYRSVHATSMSNTFELLRRMHNALELDYQLHIPVIRDRRLMEVMVQAAQGFGKPILHRTLYGNMFLNQTNPFLTWDRKVFEWHAIREPDRKKQPFLSTDDRMVSDKNFVAWLQNQWPQRSPWERI